MDERRHVDELDRDAGREQQLAVAARRPRGSRAAAAAACRRPTSASAATSDGEARPPADGAREPRLELGHVGREARGRVDGGERVVHRDRPGVQRDDRAGEQPEARRRRSPCARAAPRAPRPSGTGAPTPAGRCRRPRPAAAARAAARPGRTRARRTACSTPRGCVISRIASRPPGRSTRRSSRSAPSRSATLRTPKPTVAASKLAVLERQREQVALDPLDRRAPCAAPARASAAEKSTPTTLAAPGAHVRDGEVAGAAGAVEHAVARVDGRQRPRAGASAGRDPPS